MILEKCNVRFCSRIPTLPLIQGILEQWRSEEHSNAQFASFNLNSAQCAVASLTTTKKTTL